MRNLKKAKFFTKVKPVEFTIQNLTGKMNTHVSDLDIDDTELSGGQNMIPASDTSLKKRPGVSLYGPYLGPNPITGEFNFVNAAGTQRLLVCYNTQINIHTATTSTAISGATITAGLQNDGVYFPSTDKFYITNGTDSVIRIKNDGTNDSAGGAFLKGKYITTFQNFLLAANLSGNPNQVNYSDAQLDTQTSSNQNFVVDSPITGIASLLSMVLTFTERKIWRLQNFTFNGTTNYASFLYEIPTEFGSIVKGTVKVVNNLIYFLGQDMNSVAGIYATDGYSVQNLTDDTILATMQGLSGSQLSKAYATTDGGLYRVTVAESGQGTNNISIVYNAIKKKFYTPERRWLSGVMDMSCFTSSESNGVWSVYGGTQSIGQVYQFNTNDGLYDEMGEERHTAEGTGSYPVEEVGDLRVAQPFKMTQYNSTITVPLTQVALRIKTNAGTPGTLVVRIETDNNGSPSGTLVSSNATTTMASSLFTSSYTYEMAIFPTPVNVSGNTLYWIVIKHPVGTTNSKYLVSVDQNGNYVGGNAKTFQQTFSGIGQTFSPGSTAVDGVLFVQDAAGETFSTIRGDATGSVGGNGGHAVANLIATTTTNKFSQMGRVVVQFDTSSLPGDAVISTAWLRVYVNGFQDNFGQNVDITSASPASATALVAADYAVANFGSTTFASPVAPLATYFTANAYNNIFLNASGIANISIGGISKFGIRLSGDISNSSPTWASGAISAIDIATSHSANPPHLVVNYSTASGTAAWTTISGNVTFVLYDQAPIDGIADSKSFLPVEGKEFKLIKYETIFSTSANYFVEVGFELSGLKGTFNTFLVSLSSGGLAGKWDDNVSKWDDGVTLWDATPSRNYTWTDVGAFENRSAKLRVRNRNANQQFEFNKIILELLPRFRNV